MVRLWVFVGGLLLVLVSAAFVAPSFIDWERYRERFEAEVAILLGRDVRVGGIQTARLLPFPSITFTDVTVSEEGGGAAVAIDRLSLDAELAPFLRGEVLIFDARLERPRIDVRLDQDGRVRWTPPAGRVAANAISIERLAVTDGTLRVVDGAGRAFEASDVDLSVSADTLLGPWSVAGAVTAAGSRYTIELGTGLYEPALRGGVRVFAALGTPALPEPINLFGTATFAEGDLSYDGEFTSQGTADTPYALTGTFLARPTGVEVEEYRVAVGTAEDPYVVTGRASLAGGAEPGFELMARGQRLDTARLGEASDGGGAERLDALRRLALDAPRPGVDGFIDVSLPAIVFSDTTVRDVTVRAVAEGGDWRVERFAASLPGRTDVRGSGRLATDGSGAFEGRLVAASRQPTGLATWLGHPIEPALRDLDRLGFEASFAASDGAQRLDELVVAVGDDRLSGTARIPWDVAPIEVELAGADLDLRAARAAALGLFGGMAETEVRLTLDLDRASIDGVTVDELSTVALFASDRAEITQLAIADLRGASLSASGVLSAVGGTASELTITVRADEPAAVLALLEQRIDAPWTKALSARASHFAPLNASAQLAWLQRDAIGFEARVDTGGTSWTVGGSMTGDPMAATVAALSAEGRGPAGVLLRQGGVPAIGDGPRADVTVAYERTANGSRLDASGIAGGDTVAITLLRSGADAVADARTELSSLVDAAALAGLNWNGIADVPLDGRLTATLDDGYWTVSLEEAQVADTLVTGRLVGAEDRWQGEVATGVLDVAALSRLLAGGEADPVIGTARLPALDLVLSTEARAVTLPGGIVARDATFRATLDGDGVSIEGFRGGVAGGRLTGSASVRETLDEALVTARFGIEGADVTVLPGIPSSSLAAGTLVVAGGVEATGRTLSALLRSATGAGEAAVIDPVLLGLDPFVLSRLYERFDASADPIEAERVEELVREEMAGGRFAPDALSIDWSLSGGTLRATVAEAEDGGTTLSGQADLDLANREVSGQATARFAVPDDRAAGGAPVIRARLEDGAVEYDVSSLVGFLNLRAFEIERDRVAALRAALLEEQRLRRETLLFNTRERERREEAARRLEEAAANARASAASARQSPATPAAPAAPRLNFNVPIE